MKRIILFVVLMIQVLGLDAQLLRDTAELVVITAQRQETKSFQLAESVAVLSSSDLERQLSRSTAESLIGTPGVWMQKTNHGGGSPFLRGFTGNQTLLLLDGIRLNNSTYRYGPNQYFNTINVLNIEQIEVVRGSGSVLYGTDAIGGTINVLTRSPQFTADHNKLKTTVLGRFMSGGMEQSAAANLNWSAQKIAIYADYSNRNFGDLMAGGDLGTQAPSSYKEQAASAKMKLKLGTQSILTLAYNGVFQSDVGRYDQVAQRGYRIYQFEPQNRQLAYVKGQFETQNSFWQQIEWTASWQRSEEGRSKIRENSTIWQRERDEVSTLGLSVQFNSNLAKHWKMTSGIEAYWDQIGSTAFDTDTSLDLIEVRRGLYPDGARAANIAVYSAVNGQLGHLRMNAGLRYNFFKLQPNDENFGEVSLAPRALVGHISAHYTLAQKHALIAMISTGFRAPNINDLSSFGSFDFGIEVPTNSLKPEKSTNLELGYKFKTTKTRANASIYRIQLYDLISRIRGTYLGQPLFEGEEVYIKANAASAYVQGLEWDGRWDLHPKWRLAAGMTYTYGQNVSADEPMRRIPPLNGSLSLTFKPDQQWFFNWQNWYASQQERLSGGDISDHRIADGGTPGWWVSNLNVGFTKDWLQINGGLQNIFNEAYRIHGSGLDGVGRSIWLSLRFNFGERN